MLPARKRRPVRRPAASRLAASQPTTVAAPIVAQRGRRASVRDLIIAGLLLLAVALAYCNVARNEFINFDDDSYVYENGHLEEGSLAQTIAWAFTTTEAANWHPLTWLSHAADWRLYGDWAGGHHLTSVIIHAASTLLLYLALAGMTRAPWPSAVVAALFAIHPLHVESVAWASERKDVLSALFAMLTLWAFGRYVRAPGALWYAAMISFYVLGLLAKPMLVTLPLVMLLLDYWPLGRVVGGWWSVDGEQWIVDHSNRPPTTDHRPPATLLFLEKLPLLVIAGLSCAVTFWAQNKAGAVVSLTRLNYADRFLNANLSYVEYLGKAFFPRGLAPFYPLPQHVSMSTMFEGIAACVGMVAATAAIGFFGRKRPWLTVGWLWYVIMLVPVIGLVQVGQQAFADRYTYLPLIGISIAVVWTVRACIIAALSQLGFVAIFATAGLLALCTALTQQQSSRWVTTLALFSHTQAVTTDNPVAHNNIGLAIMAKNPKLARKHFEDAIELSYYEAHGNLGNLLTELKDYDGAMREYQTLLHINPRDGKALKHLASVQQLRGNLPEAEINYRKLLALDPSNFDTHGLLGQVLQSQGKTSAAVVEYEAAIQARPDKSIGAFNNIAWIRATHPLPQFRDGRAAVAVALRGKDLGPVDSNLLDTLAAAYAECGLFDEAQETVQQAIKKGVEEKAAGLADIRARSALYAKRQPYRDMQLLGPKK